MLIYKNSIYQSMNPYTLNLSVYHDPYILHLGVPKRNHEEIRKEDDEEILVVKLNDQLLHFDVFDDSMSEILMNLPEEECKNNDVSPDAQYQIKKSVNLRNHLKNITWNILVKNIGLVVGLEYDDLGYTDYFALNKTEKNDALLKFREDIQEINKMIHKDYEGRDDPEYIENIGKKENEIRVFFEKYNIDIQNSIDNYKKTYPGLSMESSDILNLIRDIILPHILLKPQEVGFESGRLHPDTKFNTIDWEIYTCEERYEEISEVKFFSNDPIDKLRMFFND